MAHCRIWMKPDGSVAVMVPAIPGPYSEAWWEQERAKNPDLLGAIAVLDGDSETILPWRTQPELRRLRRNAYRWNAGARRLEDDRRVTTEQEVADACQRRLDQLSATGAVTPEDRKVLARTWDLLTPAELRRILEAWRADPATPAEARFPPPGDALPIPVPRRR